MARETSGPSQGASLAPLFEGEGGILNPLGFCLRCVPASPPLCKGLLSFRIPETFGNTLLNLLDDSACFLEILYGGEEVGGSTELS